MSHSPAIDSSRTELNKALVRQMFDEMDRTPGSDVTAKWMRADYRLHMNGVAMTLEDYAFRTALCMAGTAVYLWMKLGT